MTRKWMFLFAVLAVFVLVGVASARKVPPAELSVSVECIENAGFCDGTEPIHYDGDGYSGKLVHLEIVGPTGFYAEVNATVRGGSFDSGPTSFEYWAHPGLFKVTAYSKLGSIWTKTGYGEFWVE